MVRVPTILNRRAKENGDDPNRIRSLYALERPVARLESSPDLANAFVYKGGYVLYKTTDSKRLTRDVDAQASGIGPEVALDHVTKAIAVDLGDSVSFHDPKSMELENTGEYSGLRVDVAYSIDKPNVRPEKIRKLSRIHFDVGFGENISRRNEKVPMALMVDKPGLAVSWAILPLEYIFAEKFQTLVHRGEANSRAKDIYDMWFISEKITNLGNLREAVSRVFSARNTDKPKDLAAFVSNLDFKVLRSAWGSVLFAETTVPFDDALSGLIAFLEKSNLGIDRKRIGR